MDKQNSVKAILKKGTETINFESKQIGFTLLDFWKWSVSDLLSNATRGRLAEFIVGTAIGIDFNTTRVEWDAYDLISTEGIKIEVKSAAYIQSWYQKKPSTITFSIKPAVYLDVESGKYTESLRHSDVYVFCHLKHLDKETINPLQLEQWDFYVVRTTELNKYGIQRTISLSKLKQMTNSVSYIELPSSILKLNHLL